MGDRQARVIDGCGWLNGNLHLDTHAGLCGQCFVFLVGVDEDRPPAGFVGAHLEITRASVLAPVQQNHVVRRRNSTIGPNDLNPIPDDCLTGRPVHRTFLRCNLGQVIDGQHRRIGLADCHSNVERFVNVGLLRIQDIQADVFFFKSFFGGGGRNFSARSAGVRVD